MKYYDFSHNSIEISQSYDHNQTEYLLVNEIFKSEVTGRRIIRNGDGESSKVKSACEQVLLLLLLLLLQ